MDEEEKKEEGGTQELPPEEETDKSIDEEVQFFDKGNPMQIL